MNKGKCPHCKNVISQVSTEVVLIQLPDQENCKGIQYLCTHCSTVVHVELDPLALQSVLLKSLKIDLAKKKD